MSEWSLLVTEKRNVLRNLLSVLYKPVKTKCDTKWWLGWTDSTGCSEVVWTVTSFTAQWRPVSIIQLHCEPPLASVWRSVPLHAGKWTLRTVALLELNVTVEVVTEQQEDLHQHRAESLLNSALIESGITQNHIRWNAGPPLTCSYLCWRDQRHRDPAETNSPPEGLFFFTPSHFLPRTHVLLP